LSRLLYGDVNNAKDWEKRYTKHLEALKDADIMTKINTPIAQELRGYVMLMMMRTEVK
jgi:hypothetical protein